MEQGEGGDLPLKQFQSDTPTAMAKSQLDVPTKKLARQLDFTNLDGASVSAGFSERAQTPPLQQLAQIHAQTQPHTQPPTQLPLTPVPPQTAHPSLRPV